MSKTYFVTGIGTNIGKTVVSAILTEKLQADYWKPIQSGDLNQSDSLTVAQLISNKHSVIHPETFCLNTAVSPHLSAKLDNVQIELKDFKLPPTNKNLVVEGAGGLMVPLNDQELIIDLIQFLNIPVILVVKNYLGSINHTLLSINTLHQYQIPIAGLIFNGEAHAESQRYILNYFKIPLLGVVPETTVINKEFISAMAAKISI